MNLRYLALLPLAVLSVLIFVTLFFDFSTMFVLNPPYLLLELNLIFWTIATLAIAFISSKSFIKDDSMPVLLLSSSIIIFGFSVIISGWVGSFSGNYSVAIGNICILVASIVQVLGSIFSFIGKTKTNIAKRTAFLAAVYLASIVFVIAVSAIVLLGYIPDFFTSSGPTLLRQGVLGSAVFLFVVAATIFGIQYTKSKSPSLYWYATAIGLFSIGLFSASEVKTLGDFPTWVGRIALYVGTSYLIAAILASRQKSGAGIALAGAWAEAFGSDRSQIANFFSKMLNGFAYHRILVDTSGKPIDYVFLEINGPFEKMTGLKKEEIIGRKVTEVLTGIEKDPADWIGVYGRVALNGESIQFENYAASLSKWFHISAYSPQKGYFITLFEDITDRKKADEALHHSEERFRSVLNNSLDVVYRFNLKTERYEYMSPSSRTMLGFEPEEMVAMNSTEVLSRVHPDDAAALRADLARINELGKGISEYRFMGKDGKYRWWSNQMVISRDKDGTPLYRDGYVRDITERKKADEALCYSNERLELISSIAGQLLSTSKPQTLIQELSEKVMTFLDCDVFFNFLVDEQKKQLHLNAYAGVSSEMAKTFEWLSFGEAVCGCAAQEGERIVCENIPDTHDHRTALVRSFGVKAYAAHPLFCEGKVIGTLSFGSKKKPFFTEAELSLMKTVAAQVSVALERQKAEEALQKSEEKYRLLVESPNSIIMTADKDLDITYMNPFGLSFFGYTTEELLGKNVVGTTIPFKDDEGRDLSEMAKDMIKNPEKYKTNVHKNMLKNGALVWVSWTNSFRYDQNGDLSEILAIGNDISNVKKAEAKLRESAVWEVTSQYTRNLIEASLDPLVTISVEGKITDVNRATELATGCFREELIGDDFSNYFTEPEKAKTGYKRVFTDGFVRDYPLAIRHKSGKITDVMYNATVYRSESGEIQGVFAAARDITELKRAEEQAQESAKKLKDAERLAAIGATAGMVGHDIRNPLQAITSDIYLVKTDLASFPETEEKKNVQESLGEIEKNIYYINKIVADLQDFARPLTPKIEEIDLEKTIHSALAHLNIPGNVTVKHSIRKDFPKIKADQTYIQRILTNLSNNAMQAMPNGGKLTIAAAAKNGKAIISVEDNGEGIPESIRSKLFTPLVTTKSKGQGFGLSVVKRFTEALGGTVTFESEVGKGTKFIVELPL